MPKRAPSTRGCLPVPENFEGFADRECGEHRTVGSHRAWCHACSEWCYPDSPCKGCELPILRAKIESLTDDLREAVRAWEWAMPQELFANNKPNREKFDRLSRNMGGKPMHLGRTDAEYETLCAEWGVAP